MKLHDANKGIHKHRRSRRIGRGPGSGRGKTSSRGYKGARSRAGYSRHAGFQGGAMPMIRRVPKRGFTNSYALSVGEINVAALARAFQAGEPVTPETLAARGVLKGRFDVIKVLGDGELAMPLQVSAHRFSASARTKIEQAGGTATVLPGRRPVERRMPSKGRAKAKPAGERPAN
jgi:large subunit ribosomal protein L15